MLSNNGSRTFRLNANIPDSLIDPDGRDSTKFCELLPDKTKELLTSFARISKILLHCLYTSKANSACIVAYSETK
jgi:hypothetical protein